MAAVHTCTVPQPSRKYERAWLKSETPPIPEKLRSGNALVSCDIFAKDSGRIAGPPSPPLETNPSTLISNSRVSGSISGMEGNVFDETIASAPEQEVGRVWVKAGPPANPGEAAVGERLGELRHLRQRQRKDRRPAESSARDESIDIDLEL